MLTVTVLERILSKHEIIADLSQDRSDQILTVKSSTPGALTRSITLLG
jgi:hypothetical protein